VAKTSTRRAIRCVLFGRVILRVYQHDVAVCNWIITRLYGEAEHNNAEHRWMENQNRTQ